jgi:serine/threonine protein kinase
MKGSWDVEQFGPYRLLALLGRGGMGEVWRALDTRKEREVALKVLGGWLGADPGFATRFRREASLVR